MEIDMKRAGDVESRRGICKVLINKIIGPATEEVIKKAEVNVANFTNLLSQSLMIDQADKIRGITPK